MVESWEKLIGSGRQEERSTTTMVVVAVVGCGALGSRVAGELAICGHRVRGIIRVIIVAN